MSDAEIVTLGSVTSWLSGGTPNRSNEEYWSGSVPWISASTLKDLEIYDSPQRVTAAAVRAGSKMAPIGATLILVRGMALHRELRAGIVTRPVCFNQDVKALIPAPSVLPRFLLYAIYAQGRQILDLVSSAGSGTGVLDTSLLKRVRIWLPSPRRQAEVVAILDDVERHLATMDRLIAKKQAVKQGMMQQLLIGKTRLPGFTRPWLVGPFKYFMPLQRGFDLPTPQVKPGAYPVVYSNGVARTHAIAMAKGPGVITGRSGTIGKVHYVSADYWPHNTALWVTNFAHTNAKFVYYFLSQLGLERFASGSGVPTFNRNDAHGFEVRMPSEVREQEAIAKVLTDVDDEIEALRRRLAKARAVKQCMMQELLNGSTRLPGTEAVDQ